MANGIARAGAQLRRDTHRHERALQLSDHATRSMNATATTSVGPQFRDSAQRARANQLGLWTFLATEVVFFGGLFVGYAIYRHAYLGAFPAGSARLDFWIGTINTAVLLTSSLFVA